MPAETPPTPTAPVTGQHRANRHFLPAVFLQPPHPLTVLLIGAGGTGAQVLMGLARMNHAMTQLGHPGLAVRVLDGDTVTEANLGRQPFAYAEVGCNKAEVLINRTNRFYGTNWKAVPAYYGAELVDKLTQLPTANLVLSCVDSVAARLTIATRLTDFAKRQPAYTLDTPYYWLDWGNSQQSGQVVLATVGKHPQPQSATYQPVACLPMITEEFGEALTAFEQTHRDEPSCSVAEALEKQELFVNPALAQWGLTLLWQLFRHGLTAHRGVFMNLETLRTVPLAV